MTQRRKALIIVTVWPEPESSAAGWRVLNMIDALKDAGYAITLASPSRENEFSERLKTQSIVIQPVAINDTGFDAWIAQEKFDLAVLDRFIIEEQFGWRIQENSPSTIRVLDTEDLHFLRRARQKSLADGKALVEIFSDQIELATEDACREIASIYRSDLTLILSDHEMDLLKNRFRVDPELLESFRFCYRNIPETAGFEERANFTVIGNFRHPPNADGTRWLKTELWPLIRKKLKERGEKAELHIYGAYPSKDAMNLSNPAEGFIVKGPAPDVHETLKQYRVNLAPLRFGAGIKGKISDGWRAGLPVVTTPIGAEGMFLCPSNLPSNSPFHSLDTTPLFGGAITRSPEEFSEAAARLYTDSMEWTRTREQGYAVLRGYFDYGVNARRLSEALSALTQNIQARRERNFIGQILHHQSMRSTKYFSKWIELKEGRAGSLVPALQSPSSE
jgi:glycosyltransferase involved in cell wall biosynthesis